MRLGQIRDLPNVRTNRGYCVGAIDNRPYIHQNIRACRKKKDISISEAAKRINLTQREYTDLERGVHVIDVYLICRICVEFGCDADGVVPLKFAPCDACSIT